MDTIQANSGIMALALVMTLVSRKSPDHCRVKHVYCGLDIVELCVCDAVANYNYGIGDIGYFRSYEYGSWVLHIKIVSYIER